MHLFKKNVVLFTFGLGNQLFQFVFMLYLKEKLGKHVAFDTSFYKSHDKATDVHDGFQANLIFDFSDFKESKMDCSFLYKLCRKLKFLGLTDRLWGSDTNVSYGYKYLFYKGCWQDSLYYNEIKDIIKQYELDLMPYADKTILEKILSQKSLFMHVRRGDYLSNSDYMDLCSTDYYSKAINTAKEHFSDVNIFVFSDDIEWCREYFAEYKNLCFVKYPNQNALGDLALMSYCDGGIVANSTFSWWGAMLNKDKIVIRPSKYYNNTPWASYFDNLYPSSWISIDIYTQ